MGTRAGGGLPGSGAGLNSSAAAVEADGGFGEAEYPLGAPYTSESESGEEEDALGSGGDRRGVKRERAEREVGLSQLPGASAGGHGGATGAKPGKKTRGRVKIKMEFIDNKLRRYTTFSKRKTGIMKKAYELSTLTGTQVLLLVASETGHVYTFATRKLQPMITSETGKALIQTCLNSPDSPPRHDAGADQRMSATGFEETELSYQVAETEEVIKPSFTVAPQAALPAVAASSCSSSGVVQSLPSASWHVSTATPSTSSNGTLLKTSSVVLPGGFTLMSAPVQLNQPLSIQSSTPPTAASQLATLLRIPATMSLTGGVSQQLQAVQVQPSSQASTNQSTELQSSASTATIVTSSLPSSVASHMMHPGSHTVMYTTPTPSLADGGLTVLNTFNQAAASAHEPVSQVFLTSLPPVSAVQLHPVHTAMVIGQPPSGSSSLTELQVVSREHCKD